MPLAPGASFERYEFEALVGRGGMGEVYKAIDTRLHRAVALKVLRSDREPADSLTGAGGVQRLLREARAAAAFNHANSVAIYELGEAEGIPYIAMEYVVGSSLRAFVGDRTIALDVRIGWLVDVARALHAAHRAGLVHRDVKPGNIMVSEEGTVKVLDFGLAKPTKKSDPHGFQTLMGQVLGTPRYMAPEQLEGAPADARSDQFAFGVVAYELLCGVYPGGPLAGAPQPLEQLDAAVPPRLSFAVLRMMARDPAKRFASMDEAAGALGDCVPSVRNMRVPASGDQLRARGTKSDAPTMERRLEADAQSGAVSVDVPMASAKPMMSTQPIPAAVGAEVSRRIASTAPLAAMPSAVAKPSMKTMPLSQGISSPMPASPAPHAMNASLGPGRMSAAPTSAAGPPSPMSFPSGVVHVPPAPTSSARALANPSTPVISGPIVAPRPAPTKSRSNTWMFVLAALLFLLAIAGGAVVALLYR